MTNKKKKVVAKTATPPEQDELTPERVFDMLEFSNVYAKSMMYPGAITPQMLSSAMKSISFMPLELTSDDLDKALKDPSNSESQLRDFMQHLEIVSMPAKRLVNYMHSMLAFDLTYTPKGSIEERDLKSTSYKKCQAVLDDFLDDFNYKFYLRNAVKQMIRNETYVFCPRDDGDKFILQELPLDRCMITGRFDYGFIISFDMAYFLQPGVDIRYYPKFFKEKYKDMFQGSEKGYMPAINSSYRGGSSGQSALWVDVPPDVAFAFKLDPSLVTSIPYFSGLFSDLINQPLMRTLQKNVNMSAASKLILGKVPMRDMKTNIRDAIAIDADTLAKFLALIQSALSESIKLSAAPLEDLKGVSFDSENELYSSYLKTTIDSSGVNSSMVYSGDLKANAIETQLAFQSDSKIMEMLYEQFNLFMEYQIKRRIDEKIKTKEKYYFIPEFEGNDYDIDRKRRLDNAIELAQYGVVLPMKISAAMGMKPSTMRKMLLESKATKFVEELIPMVAGFNSSKESMNGESGRPRKDDSDLSEAGAETRADGSNVAKGGKV